MSATEVCAKAEKLAAEVRRDTIIGLLFTSFLTLIGLIGASRSAAGRPGRADYRYDRCGHPLARGVSDQYEAKAACWRSICNVRRVLSW
jgi:hypothetical protein